MCLLAVKVYLEGNQLNLSQRRSSFGNRMGLWSVDHIRQRESRPKTARQQAEAGRDAGG